MPNNNPNETEAKTQNVRILRHLKAGKTITALQALRMFGCMRLSARILDLKRFGYDIDGAFICVVANGKKKRVKEYRLYSLPNS